MSLVLTIEHGPRAQARSEARLDMGELVIGRSPEADWQIDDPDKFVSRTHCKITAEQDGYVVTDVSSSGLFIDDSSKPLGPGNSARLRSGMRLRLGDYVLWVDVREAGAAARPQARTALAPSEPVGASGDDFFSQRAEEKAAQPRPANLPNPFELPHPGGFQSREGTEGDVSPAFDDPFSLDSVATPKGDPGSGHQRPAEPLSFGDSSPPRESRAAKGGAFSDDFSFEPVAPRVENSEATGARKEAQDPDPEAAPWEMPSLPAAPAAGHAPAQGRLPASADHPGTADALALRAAFLRGLGMDDAEPNSAEVLAEMERFGREYRLMMEGLMQLLRKRAEEKGNARVAQTVVGASEVNPLKFLPTVDDALATIMSGRSAGFLSSERAITDAVRDLAQHHVRAWRGVQEALRRMIDRFDPAALEEELKSGSSIETILAGGRGAKLWELYRKRHREIAQSAENRFLGEIGADFRNAYEEE